MSEDSAEKTRRIRFKYEDLFRYGRRQFGDEIVYHVIGLLATIGLLLIGGLIFKHEWIPMILLAGVVLAVGGLIASLSIGGIIHAKVHTKDDRLAKEDAIWFAGGLAMILLGIMLTNLSLTGKLF
ncbi:MAG TPA: hypothetical protein VG917_02090 [Patescibacteria group bacterium]|nr:hypothetical protein [Patescibacteria group bacterium]